MKKYCALRFNHSLSTTRVLGFGTYDECQALICNDYFIETPNFHFFILETTNKVSQGYIENDLSNIIYNVAWALKCLDNSFNSPEKYFDIKKHINKYLFKDVDDLINNSL